MPVRPKKQEIEKNSNNTTPATQPVPGPSMISTLSCNSAAYLGSDTVSQHTKPFFLKPRTLSSRQIPSSPLLSPQNRYYMGLCMGISGITSCKPNVDDTPCSSNVQPDSLFGFLHFSSKRNPLSTISLVTLIMNFFLLLFHAFPLSPFFLPFHSPLADFFPIPRPEKLSELDRSRIRNGPWGVRNFRDFGGLRKSFQYSTLVLESEIAIPPAFK